MAAVCVPFRLSVIASEGSEAEHALTLEALQITRLASTATSPLAVDRFSSSTISWRDAHSATSTSAAHSDPPRHGMHLARQPALKPNAVANGRPSSRGAESGQVGARSGAEAIGRSRKGRKPDSYLACSVFARDDFGAAQMLMGRQTAV